MAIFPVAADDIEQVDALFADSDGPIIAVSDFMTAVPDQVARWMPRSYMSLGTDGYGRSDTREALRSFFEIDMPHIVVAVLESLAADGEIDSSQVVAAINHYEIDTEATNPHRTI